MSFFTDLREAVRNLALLGDVLQGERRARFERAATEREYYEGDHRQQLVVKQGQANDNITANFTGLVVDRGISMLLGQGVTFDLPGDPVRTNDPQTGVVIQEDQPNQAYIDEVWEANKRDILLHKLAQFGGMHGTPYLRIYPDGVESRTEENKLVPRLVPLDPAYMEVIPMPEDIDTVLMYRMTFSIVDGAGKRRNRKEEVERVQVAVDEQGNPTSEPDQIAGMMDSGWMISNYINGENGGWELISEETWPYEFPPIIHWQNLPLAGSVYGKPDVSPDVIELQDRINFVAGNINRIIRYHAHPKTWGRMFGSTTQMSWGADDMIISQSPDAMLANLEMQSDLVSSREFLHDLRKSLFDITRTVDVDSIADKLGALTNFGVRVLFMDALAKLQSKQQLYGEALSEVNHRLLVIAGINPSGGGTVVWPDPLPTSEQEDITGLTFDLQNELVSKETASTARGYDWITERNRINAEKEEQQSQSDNIGALFLRNFERGNINRAPTLNNQEQGVQNG